MAKARESERISAEEVSFRVTVGVSSTWIGLPRRQIERAVGLQLSDAAIAEIIRRNRGSISRHLAQSNREGVARHFALANYDWAGAYNLIE